jgi:hypothetical protein
MVHNSYTPDQLRTAPVATNADRGLVGKYYLDDGNIALLATTRFLMRTEPVINLIGCRLTNSRGPVDNFLVKYEGYITAPITGDYKIGGISDDGVRIYINGSLALDSWAQRPLTDTYSSPINLTAGALNKIVIEYYEQQGGAGITLKWDGPAGVGVIENKYLSPQLIYFLKGGI